MQRYYFFLTCANFLAKKFNKISFCNLYFTFQCIAQVVIVNHHRVFLDELITWTLCSRSSSHFIKQVWTLHFFTSTNQTTESLSISQSAYFIIRNRRSKFPILTFHHLFTFLLPQSSIFPFLNLPSVNRCKATYRNLAIFLIFAKFWFFLNLFKYILFGHLAEFCLGRCLGFAVRIYP